MQFEANGFEPLTNWQPNDPVKEIQLDYTDAVINGFVIPSARQTNTGKFEFSFNIKNNNASPRKYYYKIYYQNESYSFPYDHRLASENFYGSWEDSTISFLETETIPNDGKFHTVKGEFRIVGNPRNERKYFGSTPDDGRISKSLIRHKMNEIMATPDWFRYIKEKAAKTQTPLERQLELDAIYALKELTGEKTINNRWKRNPRVGSYSFMIVVTDATNLEKRKIPSFVKYIGRKNIFGRYVNPYSFFFAGNGKDLNNVVVIKSDRTLKVSAKPELRQGIYIDPYSFSDEAIDTTYYSPTCNDGDSLHARAHFRQFIHNIDKNAQLNNIPVVADVAGGGYSVSDYRMNLSKGPAVKIPVRVSNCPCKTVHLDSAGTINLINPGTKEGEWRKENVGLITRHGLTYGKYTVKVKLPELLNEHKVWNGLTNAVWMIYQPGEWNQRRACKNLGYIPKDKDGPQAPRVSTTNYSEIDFEIVKAPRYWPKTSYKDQKRPRELTSDSSNIMVTCTNWDMACHEPSLFKAGIYDYDHNGQVYAMHRWDDWYKALTTKYAASDDEVFGSDHYYFEIDWRPHEIIWRIGPEKNKLREVAYMSEWMTSVPNNQMLLVVTQEFHLAKWWPESPFDQDKVPFPGKDIVGKVIEVEIE